MNSWTDVKERLALLLMSDNDMPEESVLKKAFSAAVHEILQSCEPMRLISRDRVNYEPFRYLDGTYFIRKPGKGEEWLEDGLTDAAAYLLASRFASFDRRNTFIKRFHEAVGAYTANTSSLLEAIGFRGRAGARDDIPMLLEMKGRLRHYDTEAAPGGVKARYLWHAGSVDALDMYMLKGGGLASSLITHHLEYCAVMDSGRRSGVNSADYEAYTALDRIFADRLYTKRKQYG